jgi:hypothetical protein
MHCEKAGLVVKMIVLIWFLKFFQILVYNSFYIEAILTHAYSGVIPETETQNAIIC